MSASTNNAVPTLRPASPGHPTARLTRTPSHEALNAHPLLSPGTLASLSTSSANGTSSSNTSVHSSAESATSPSHHPAQPPPSAPKYLPYTPRQARVVTGSATTGTASSPVSVSPQQHQHAGGATAPSATSRLQLQNLKAVAQHHGLDAGCLGWAMLEELVAGSDHAPVWTEVWAVIATGKAALLLPTELAGSREVITPELVKDHIIFCEGSARDDSPFVTLSGMRGIINGDDLTIQSTVPTSSKLFKALSDPSTRSTALATLPPLPTLSNSALNYPRFSCPRFIPSLPLPPRSAIPPKPPLPPRPGTKPPASSVSRLANPFASFFAKSPAPTSPAPTTQPLPDVAPVDHVSEVSAFTIDHPIIRRNVSKSLAKYIKVEIKEALTGLPTWVIDRTQNFSSSYLPFPKPAPKPKDGNGGSQFASDQSSFREVSAFDDPAEEVSERFQEFYASLEEELRVDGSPSTLRRKDDKLTEEEKERERHELDLKVQNILEKVENTLTSVFYDRLYRPSSSDDASHDEALSSRINALNKLDLSLDHLGVDAGPSKDDVYRIVEACGQTISQLEVACCPADKAAILVASHRIIVDGLSRLPPLHLKSEDNADDDKTPQAPNFKQETQPSTKTKRDQSRSPTRLTVSPDPLSDPPVDKSLEESITTETIKGPLLEDSASAKSVPSFTLSPAEEASTPLLSVSPPKTPTPVSGDILLPLIIFSVVKANPPKLVSHLLFTQRYRNQSIGGEESYCLINLMAVVEFLENVDLGALGLKESEKNIVSAADLTPIPLSLASDKSPVSTPGGGLRGRVEQQVDAIAGSANKVLSGVVDSGFGVLLSLLPTAPTDQTNASTGDNANEGAPWNNLRPGFGLLRRESGFSIASLAASLPGAGSRERARSIASSYQAADEEGQEMVESRPGSVRNMLLEDGGVEEEDEEEEEEEGESEEDGESGEDEEGDEEDEEEQAEMETRHDTRSIRSFESMMSSRSREREKHQKKRIGKGGKDANANANTKKGRMSIADRLASMSRITSKSATIHSFEPPTGHHHGSPPPRSSSLLATTTTGRDTKEPIITTRFDTPLSSRTSSPVPIPSTTSTSLHRRSFTPLPPPSRRFLECSADDLRMSEIPELLNEYRRLVEGVRSLSGFDEPNA
ncbi:uncharacterized protein FOMMEDRAFT_143805 [Fomitiporia mediterranea MF3/22]|uniref:uncharacterized protein n=1 Tax=Fomitiporia mediterranea (strain MF3/22) TaxID=694068 RepID=UPI000440876B|nr:uncharacterized protein FOMMEDRAFT_143805 [Fomitiporia mediterranea MF3/22]EJD07368.1 hypothetical protein FOMMEDRAFT_143805 [Fomitiporia mediterranea MF3/22]